MPKMSELTATQVKILKILATFSDDEEGVTKEHIMRVAGLTCIGSDVIGPTYIETLKNHPKSLWARGLVNSTARYEGEGITFYWNITPKGRTVAEKMRIRGKSTQDMKIPKEILDPIGKSMKGLLTYGWENLTPDDLRAIRSKLPEEYRIVSDHDLRSQFANRRKVGAFAEEKTLPKWYMEYRETPEFKEKERKCLERWYYECAINCSHGSAVKVYHRRMECELTLEDGGGWDTIIDNEGEDDLIPLCEKCALRLMKSLEPIPKDEPSSKRYDTSR